MLMWFGWAALGLALAVLILSEIAPLSILGIVGAILSVVYWFATDGVVEMFCCLVGAAIGIFAIGAHSSNQAVSEDDDSNDAA